MEASRLTSSQAARLTAEALPKELLAILPPDPYDQLDLAARISTLAYTQKVSSLEHECGQLRSTIMQKNSQVKALERRVQNLELEVKEAAEKTRQSLEEQTKLVGEKNALIGTVKKLNRDVSKLENFKRNLLHTLQDEDDNGKIDAAAAAVYDSDRIISGVMSTSRGADMGGDYSFSTGQTVSGGMAATPSTSGNTRVTPRSAMSPPGVGGLSPSVGASPRVDGKEFFRQARARLSYEQFSQFLQNIKELNAHRQTREETLKTAQGIFGSANGDLYVSFESLLSRHLPV